MDRFIGSILAPDATLTNGSYIDGSVFVESFNGQGEVHFKNNGYVVKCDGFDPQAVPEPSSVVMIGLGVIGAGGFAWRQRGLKNFTVR